MKTVLLELTTQSCEGIENAYLFEKSLIKKLSEAYKNGQLPNFFNPFQNLLENEKENFKGIVNTLDKLIVTMEQPENISYSKLIVDKLESKPYNSPLRFKPGNFATAITVLGKVEHTTDFPILDCESNPIPPRSVSSMLFTELYNVFFCSVQAWIRNCSLRGEITDFRGKITEEQFQEKIDGITIHVIQMQRIIRLLQQQELIILPEDKDIYDKILKFPVDFVEVYLQSCLLELPKFVKTRIQYDKCSVETPNESTSIDIDATRAHIVKEVKGKITKLNECQRVKQFIQNLTSILKVIVERKLVQLVVSEDELLQKCPSGLLTDLFDQRGYFQELDEKVKKFKIEECIFESTLILIKLFNQIFHCDNGERREKEIIVKELEKIYNRISMVDAINFKDVIEKLKMKLGEFLSHFYEMPKLPEKVDGANEEEYNKLMTIYKTEMEKKMKQVEEMNYNGVRYGFNKLHMLNDGDINNRYKRFASEKLVADFESVDKCICGIVGYGYEEDTRRPPFYLFQLSYWTHCN